MVIKEIAANDNSDDDPPPGAAAPVLRFPRQECSKDEADARVAGIRKGPLRFGQKRLALTEARGAYAIKPPALNARDNGLRVTEGVFRARSAALRISSPAYCQ